MANPFIQQQDSEELAILRRQRMAEQLMQQAQQPMEQGQMVSGIYVKPNFTQYLAKGLQQYMGARGVQQADEEAKALYEGRQAQTQAERQKFAELLRPKPAITLPADQQGPVAPEQPGDLNAATMLAMQSRDPALQSFAFNSLANQPALAEARATRAEERAFRAKESELARQARIDQLAQDHQNRMEVLAANNASQAARQAEQQAFLRQMKGMGEETKPPVGYRFKPDKSGNLEKIPGGPADISKDGSASTESERKAATLLQRLQFSEDQLTKALVNDPNAAKPELFTSALNVLSTPLANTLTPEARQRVESAQLDILDSALTLGTGAAYTKEQLEGYRRSYFPQIGDKPEQVKDKKARLENIISAAKIAAGRSATLVPSVSDVSGSKNTVTDPTGMVHTFPTAEAAAAFKKAAGIK